LAEVLAAEVDERSNRRRARRLHEGRSATLSGWRTPGCTVAREGLKLAAT
jgi:hypothetical protein